jgi:hypothetical protein
MSSVKAVKLSNRQWKKLKKNTEKLQGTIRSLKKSEEFQLSQFGGCG